MAEEEELHERIRRYRNLHALNPDARVRAELERMIQEAQARLDGLKRDDDFVG